MCRKAASKTLIYRIMSTNTTSRYTYTIEDIYDTLKTATSKKEAVEAAKEICNRRRINIYVYRVDKFGATSSIGHAEYVGYLKEVRFYND